MSSIEKFNSMMETLGDSLTQLRVVDDKLILITGQINVRELRVPDGVEEIHSYYKYGGTFDSDGGCKAVTITEGNAVISVEDTDERNGALEKVSIPDSVKCIGPGAFTKCRGLKEIAGAQNVVAIQRQGLSHVSIQKLDMPNLMYIGPNGMQHCRVEELTSKQSLTIDSYGLSECSKLNKLDAKLYRVGKRALEHCSALPRIEFSNDWEKWHLGRRKSQKYGDKFVRDRFASGQGVYGLGELIEIDIGDSVDINGLKLSGCVKVAKIIAERLEELDLGSYGSPRTVAFTSKPITIVLSDIEKITVYPDEEVYTFVFNSDAKVKIQYGKHSNTIKVKAGQKINNVDLFILLVPLF